MNPALPSVRPEDESSILDRTERKLKDESTLRAARKVISHVRLLFHMMRDWSFATSWKTRSLILAALLYFVIPFDATPDFVPFIGYVDDAAVLGFVIRRLSREIDRYKQHLAWS
jgi:uncharacterized membrane protein YkvA (DUF1232 family)